MNVGEPARPAPPSQERTKGLVAVVRPTLVAAVGGTGVAAAKHTIASIKEMLDTKSAPAWLAVRAFDTDMQDNRQPRLENSREFVRLGNFNVRAVLDAVHDKPEFRHMKAWLPPLLSAQQISTGVGGLRPKGRLCYCHKREDVKFAIRSAMAQIRRNSGAREINDTGGLIVDVMSGIDVHIISSVCGGTGSSMVLDLAYDIRNWADSVTTGDVTISGHLVLPGAFARKPVLTSVLEANAYAALQELDRFMRGDKKDPWRMQYGPSDIVESHAPPFDYCYLLDGVGPSGTTDVDEIVSIIGDTIAQMTVGSVGATLKSQIRNTTDTILSRTDQKDRPCCYSSYGLVMMEVQNEPIIRSTTAPIAEAVAKQLRAPLISRAGIDDRLNKAVDLLGSGAEELARQVAHPQLPRRQEIESTSDDYPDNARRIVEEDKQALSEAFFTREVGRLKIDLNANAMISETLERELAEILSSNGGSGCVDYLEKLRSEIGKRRQQIREVVRGLRGGRVGAGAPDIGTPFDPGEITSAEESIRVETVRKLLDKRDEVFGDLEAFIAGLCSNWQSFCSRFNYEEELTSEKPRGGRVSAADENYFKREVQRVKADIVSDVLRKLSSRISDWRSTGMSNISEEIRQECSESWRNTKGGDHDCERTLRNSGDKWKDRFMHYVDSAMPMWEVDEGYPLADKIHEISAIGTFRSSQLAQTLDHDESKLQACDDQRRDLIPIVRTQHGLSLIGLKRLAIYRRPFIQGSIDEQRWDFHQFNDRRWISTMEFPDEPESYLRDYRVFCLANILEMIVRHEPRGYEFASGTIPEGMRPTDPIRSRRETFVFLQERGQFDQLEGEVDKRVRQQYGTEVSPQARGESAAGFRASVGTEKYIAEIRKHIGILNSRIDKALVEFEQGERSRSEGILKADIWQIHTEIRALQSLLRERQIGL
jgi:tubulin-like protein